MQKIEAIGFDWDGTLVDSMSVKSRSFTEATIRFYPNLKEKAAEVVKLYLASRGNPRIDQLELIQAQYSLKKLSNDDLRKWSNLFTSLYLDKKTPLFADAIRVLNELKNRGYKLFLCSSVPQADLDKTLKRYPLDGYFEIILGTRDNGKFRKGLPHLTYVSKTIGVPLNKIAFIGDGPDDAKGANETGCYSVGIMDSRIPNSDKDIRKNNPDLVIEQLEELLNYFK
ncbi:MAG: hypothetical protein COY66_00835 [Candidatus Kerfeldbacteria bacterium CG_4_10_14_0_8_um_filter_42_10]|uniref:HAD family hydrolase n=1 Tax=Candidatus Kerfeldbacteria bacterium CG_4_10_14_0_8_um_filter_42_10 TaxID=2014248 RepID=A0A2M7RKS2_9BACT|nr:MAG: hypothetical protein COY66_00835 [Candidatus Kerfeldbacteria bacterium CG_4_10_14_0_8_um_filter_42_10]